VSAPETSYRILLVDDDPEDLEIVEALLGDIGVWTARVTTASSYEEALERIGSEPFDVALIDYRLGPRRGDALIGEPAVRAARLPVIILTGEAGIETDLAVGRAGAADFLPKRDLGKTLLERAIRYTVETHWEHRRGDRFRALIETTRDLLSIVDASGKLVYASPSLERTLGFAPDEKVGADALAEVHPDDVERVREALRRLVEEPDRLLRLSYRVGHRDGSWRTLDTAAQNRLDDPLIRGIVVNSWDITELEEQRRRTEFQAALLEHVGQLVLAVDREGRVTYWNRAAEEKTGFAAEEMLGRVILEEILEVEDQPRGLEARRTTVGGEPWSGELAVRTKDGRTLQVQTTVSPMTDPDGTPAGRIAVGADVTDLRLAQEERLLAAERVRFQASLLDAVGQAVIATDLRGRVTYWNRAAEAIFGWPAADALGRSVVAVTPSDQDREQAAEVMRALEKGESWAGQMELRRRDGSTFPALVTDAPIVDHEGELVGIVGVTSDLSEQRALEEQLRHAQKMEAVGRLAGGVAHDFNNMLTAIRGNAALMEDELPAASPLREDVREILRAAERASTLTRQLLAFSRKQVMQTRWLSLDSVVRGVEPMLRRLVPESIRLEVEPPREPVRVMADPGQLEQVIMNLVVNAVDASPEDGEIRIRVETEEIAEGEGPAELPPGRHARLSVVDAGTGIAPEVRDHIFEPFFTTKPEGQGTGLGLSTVYGIIRQSQGHVAAVETPGGGTTFHVWLPLVDGEQPRPSDAPDAAALSSIPPDRAVILLVEDNDAVRRLTKRALERQGHTVIAAVDGRSALEVVDRGTEIDLLLSDVVMPALGGHELAHRLRRRLPGLKVVLTSGYSEAALRGEVRTVSDAFLVKPFTPEDLSKAVREALAR
jgi:two-component system cell cycle sensor histidine kinase/response regulator CckA